MINVSLGEKIKYFIDMISDNVNTLYIMGILLILTLLVLVVYRKNNKLVKGIFIGLYFLIIISLIFIYHQHIISLFDYLVENIVANLLFPNLAIYALILLIINIVVIVSLLSNKVKYYVKSINIVYFGITQLFLYLIIDNVIRNDINIYEKLSIYTNQDLLILIELSMQLFVVWIIVLTIIKFVDYLMNKSEKEIVIENNKLVINNEIETNNNYNNSYNSLNELIEYVPIKKKKNI